MVDSYENYKFDLGVKGLNFSILEDISINENVKMNAVLCFNVVLNMSKRR